MRSILVALVMGIFLLLSLPVYVVFIIIGLFNKHACAMGSQRFVNLGFRLLMFLAGAKITVLGTENIPKDRPVLYVSNHRSYADIPLAYTSLYGPTGFIAKKEVRKFPIMSWWMCNMNCLFLDRDDMKQGLKTILKAIDNVKAGYSAFIMPEGTRNHAEEMLPFKEGSFKIAEKAECPVVPVAILNTDELYEKHRPWIHGAKVVIHYGIPIDTAGMSREERKQLCPKAVEQIENMIKEDRELIK